MSNKRTKGVTVVKPIVYGNVATLLPQKKIPDSDHTHKWTVSVRGLNNEDISYFVKKVTFKLHETYANPQRVVEHPPFELTETGWGEFELTMKLQFVPESGEKPVTLYHNLRLHPYEEDGSISTANKNKPVQSFQYDELVFTEPTEYLHQLFLQHQSSALQPRSAHNPYSVQAEVDEIRKIEEATKKVQEQLTIYKNKLDKTTKELDEVKAELERVKK